MSTTSEAADSPITLSIVTSRVARLRLINGLLQGLLLYGLYYAARVTQWPATNSYLYAPLLLICLFVPVLFNSAFGHLEKRLLWKWMLAAVLVCIALGVHDIWRMDFSANWSDTSHTTGRYTPSGWMIALSALGFFIAHVFVLAAARDRRRIATYATYFDAAWKLAIQILFAIFFVGALWLILWVGAALFMLIKLEFLQRLLDHAWFVIPVLAFALSTALHVTDVRPRIVHGIRSLLLVLMSWLLPLAALIVGGFLISLPLVGLEPLWATRHATSVLLSAAAILIVLINAAFQDGEVGDQIARVLRISARIACLLLLPIACIAIYALALRVSQYGWTDDRIKAASCLLIATCYAIGYLWSALERKGCLARIAQTNIFTALLVVLVLFSLYTPLADPARLSVSNQVTRLVNGVTTPAHFDFTYLRFEGARYGDAALHELQSNTHGEHADIIRKQAAAALAAQSRWESKLEAVATTQTRTDNITVYPVGASLPAEFLQQNWNAQEMAYTIPVCLRQAAKRCEAYLLDISGDGHTDILLSEDDSRLYLFTQNTQGQWYSVGIMNGGYRCKDVPHALREGQYQIPVPEFRDLEVGGRRLRLQRWNDNQPACQE